MRIKCGFIFANARGMVHMDLALGDLVESKMTRLEKIRYRDQVLVGTDFQILAYPSEAIFAEKLQIAIKRMGNNTRMKDYYDLYKLSKLDSLDATAIKLSIERTFNKRGTPLAQVIGFDFEVVAKLQAYWVSFIRKMKIKDAPGHIQEIIDTVNLRLRQIYQP